ncbi:hypothetical protein CNMCM7691_000481 [Aspergillus felis]|uniref:Uncharacterized protein n=1 Tax=Aspergillus felis TaxID=1287682 RepID=A0A8H6QYL8_9EURO|nr:hypothetical protein CNMCM7691_000481 [Aspergillus felis]
MANPSTALSIVQGSTEHALWELTLGQLADQQAEKFGSKDAIIVPWSSARLSFRHLSQRSQDLAKGLLAKGVTKGDRVGIFSSDDERFIELFFAVGRIGAILVVLNKTYTVQECDRALRYCEPNILFLGDIVNQAPSGPLVQHLRVRPVPSLKHVVLIRSDTSVQEPISTWDEILHAGRLVTKSTLNQAESTVRCREEVIFQFTSGTTGVPKAAMLSHFNVVNNARFIGERLNLTTDDVVCCSPPLFHCFGLVAGMLASLIHGSTTVFPHRDFDASAVIDALVKERCTVLHGVPTMFSAILQQLHQTGIEIKTLRTGIVAGSKVPPTLLREVQEKLGYRDIAITYGMTETSPASFMTKSSDTEQQKLESVGTALPHVRAKVADSHNRVLPRGARGELCVSGYLLQQGYYKNPEKTAEAMICDKQGILWMHTGDEALIDEQGYCQITGRLKDIIIRGGENIYPLEIEERLILHPAIEQASVVGVKDEKYGESVCAFLQSRPGHDRPSLAQVKDWVRGGLGRHKAPEFIWWVGPHDPISQYPATGSGKIRKDILREMGNAMVEHARALPAKL